MTFDDPEFHEPMMEPVGQIECPECTDGSAVDLHGDTTSCPRCGGDGLVAERYV